MDERFLQSVWQLRQWTADKMSTADGVAVEILHPGIRNRASGPDFSDARIKIGDILWAGDIELHVRASDWHRHNHDTDSAYDHVILHVVAVDDTPIARPDGNIIPQIVLTPKPGLLDRYHDLIARADIDVACQDTLRTLPSIIVTDWINALALDRLKDKASRIDEVIRATQGDWEEAAYRTLARALGFGTNADPMERLAKSLPLKIIRKHADSTLSVEALLFGQAGFLEGNTECPYHEALKTEYAFLAKKFGLTANAFARKTSGIRPANFPHRRLALLATIIANNPSICGKLLSINNIDSARDFFAEPLSGWWSENYTFRPGEHPRQAKGDLTEASLQLLIINSVVPFALAYGLHHGDEHAVTKAIETLEQLPAERNRIVSAFTYCGIRCTDALTSQALIHLRRKYCEQRKCLDCRFGFRALTQK